MTNIQIQKSIDSISSVKNELTSITKTCSTVFDDALSKCRIEKTVAPEKINTLENQKKLKVGYLAMTVAGVTGLAINPILKSIDSIAKDKPWIYVASACLLATGVLGEVVVNKKSKNNVIPLMNKEEEQIDFDKLYDILYDFISKTTKSINKAWNNCVDNNLSLLTQEILNSPNDELTKSQLLAKASAVVSPSITTSKFSSKLQDLCAAKDIEGLRNFMIQFKKAADDEIQHLSESQTTNYQQLLN